MPWGEFFTILGQALIVAVVLFIISAVAKAVVDGFKNRE